ncbi:hypothetical protein HDV57DRAFT_349972 [Trichoderma longibrachiatum]
MMPITCSVMNSYNGGVPGVRVILECQDRFYNCFAQLEAFTDHDGVIRSWNSIPSIYDSWGIPSQTLNRLDIPRASLQFQRPSSLIDSAPWTSIRTDLLLAGVAAHVILRLEANPRLEYTAPPFHSSASNIQLAAPSPLRLPSPNFSLSEEYGNTGAEDLSDLAVTRPAVTQPSLKRKRGVESPSSAKKPRTWIGAFGSGGDAF